jgi:peptidoglycan/LPS O-acetylase OafA/YrhL
VYSALQYSCSIHWLTYLAIRISGISSGIYLRTLLSELLEMDYRREIDGLRALAVLPVIFFHAGFQTFSGGFVGVDVFFVISGYLITSIIFFEKQAGTFTFLNFYERRARRILPALFVVTCACLPFAWLLMNPHQLKEFSQSLVAVALFSSNILFWKQSDYFDAEAALKPLLHTWSLGIEEQYYLVFPALLMLVWRLGQRNISFFLLIIAAISLAAAQWGSVQQPEATYYLLPTRAWELLLGSFVAFSAYKNDDEKFGAPLKQLFSFVGLALVVFSICWFNTKTPFPSLYALLPTVGAALIILFGTQETFVGKLLGSKVFVGIGLISYSLYLWHQPILAFLKISNRNNGLTIFQYFVFFIFTFGLSFITYKLVETQFRRKALSRKSLFATVIIFTAILVLLGYSGHQTKGFLKIKLSEIPIEKRSILVDVSKERGEAEKLIKKHSLYLNQKFFEEKTFNRKVLFIGDSMTQDLSTALTEHSELFPNFQFRHLYLDNECLYAFSKLDGNCIEGYKRILSSSLINDSNLIVINFLWKEDVDFAIIEEFIASVKRMNSNILILGSAGFLDMASVTYDLAKTSAANTQDELDKIIFKSRRVKFDRGNFLILKLSEKLALQYFDRKDLYCNYASKQCRMISLVSGSILWDNAHLSKYGMKVTADKVHEYGLLN